MLTEIELKKMNPAKYNPRVTLTEGMREYQALKESLEEFGDVEPIVWNKRTGNIVGGHQRYNILLSMGVKKALVSVVDISEEEEKALNIALNNVSGEWDDDKLRDLLQSLDTDDIQVTGFGMEEVALLLENSGEIQDEFDEAMLKAQELESDYQYGMSWVVTIHFDNTEQAEEWAEKENYQLKIRNGKRTSVVRVEA